MLLEQNVYIKWNPKNKKIYENKGYVFTKWNDLFLVRINDLSHGSKAKVKVKCDYCGDIIIKDYYSYILQHNEKGDSCYKCFHNKIHIDNNYSKLDMYKKVLSGEVKKFPNEYFTTLNNKDIKEIIRYFVNLLIKDKIINNIDELPSTIRSNIFKKYKLISLIDKYDFYNLINIAYPNKWMCWEMCKVTKNYWQNNNNIILAGNWLVSTLYKNKEIFQLDDIININNKDVFCKYNLSGLLADKFNDSPYLFWNYLYPNKWYEWEFKMTCRNYWSKKENRIKALKQLCENKLLLKIEDIPQHINYTFLVLDYHKFSLICDQYYHSNIFKWINECYPNQFKPEDFKQIIASDGTKLKSKEEKIIHEYLIGSCSNVKYYDNNQDESNKWYNEVDKENYVADWLVNNNIIIEYFGLYNDKLYNKNEIITNYIDKTKRKISFYNSLDEYNFVDLYKNDLKNDLFGVKNKLDYISN